MPYSDIQHQDFEELLDIYTVKYSNGRYDIINHSNQYESYNNVDYGTHSFNYDKDSSNIKQYFYNYYNTYRRDITADSYNVKINETTLYDYITILNSNYYNITDTNNFTTNDMFNYKGIAINYNFACNGALASLEDIFAEYGYDYIVAKDQELFNNTGKYYYFSNNVSIYELQFAYKILTTNESYIDEETGESVKPEYDGTYIPNVEQLLSGQLYIVIKSIDETAPARKIYFNNQYIPSLFINDDKYNERYINTKLTSDNYKYILQDSQPMKLCDINRYRSWGYKIQWLDDFIVFKGNYAIWNFGKGIYNIIDTKIKIHVPTIDSDTNKYHELFNNSDSECGIALSIVGILMTYNGEDSKIFGGQIGEYINGNNTVTTNYRYADYIKYGTYHIPAQNGMFNDNQKNSLIGIKGLDKKTISFYKPNNAINNILVPSVRDHIMGPVSRPKTVNDLANLQIIVIPSIYIKGFSMQDSPQNPIWVQSTTKDNNITLYKNTDNSFTYINPILSSNSSIYQPDLSSLTDENNNNIFKYVVDSSLINKEIGNSSYDINFEKNGKHIYITGTNNKPNVTPYYNAMKLTINSIPFNDMEIYQLRDNCIQIDWDTSLNIKLKFDKKIPGFFEPVDDDSDYIPVFLTTDNNTTSSELPGPIVLSDNNITINENDIDIITINIE